MTHPRLVPDSFPVPSKHETDRFLLRMLTIQDVEQDFEAVSSSKTHLQKVWGTTWPEGLTLEQNLIDLGWHQKEFQRRTSFAYTVVAPDESMVLGCVYIYPSRKKRYDAEVYFWARQDTGEPDLEPRLERVIRDWIRTEWPFTNPVFPGKDMPLKEWENNLETR